MSGAPAPGRPQRALEAPRPAADPFPAGRPAVLLAIALALASGCASGPNRDGSPGRPPAGDREAVAARAPEPGPAAVAETGAGPAIPTETPAQAWERLSRTFPATLPPMPADGTPLNKGLVVGTWAPDPEQGFDQAWIDEAATVQVWTKERAGRRQWRGMTSAGDTVPVDALLRDRDGPAIGYLFSLLARRPPDASRAPDAAAVLHVRHRGRLRLWFDGRLLLDAPPASGVAPAEEHVPVVLTGPYDIVLLKLGRGSPELGPSMDVELRVSDLQGRALGEMIWTTMRTPGLPSDLPEPGEAAPGSEAPAADG